ncbi:hypothetical protein BURPS1710b_A1672 [Burkholderia pseudomallei 1710b]|uniref:Uncharacterized protein n=1 Tax=Burkholderia pseudomallei (strain 1710b) TaxID=320372 RepID=Q3JHX4_BURP1|nr:hypothetical protein BURPS1710b_A1672 [Burkholderia pseudomallei 1710b]
MNGRLRQAGVDVRIPARPFVAPRAARAAIVRLAATAGRATRESAAGLRRMPRRARHASRFHHFAHRHDHFPFSIARRSRDRHRSHARARRGACRAVAAAGHRRARSVARPPSVARLARARAPRRGRAGSVGAGARSSVARRRHARRIRRRREPRAAVQQRGHRRADRPARYAGHGGDRARGRPERRDAADARERAREARAGCARAPHRAHLERRGAQRVCGLERLLRDQGRARSPCSGGRAGCEPRAADLQRRARRRGYRHAGDDPRDERRAASLARAVRATEVERRAVDARRCRASIDRLCAERRFRLDANRRHSPSGVSRGARRRSAGVEPRALERIRRRRARQSRGARRAIDTSHRGFARRPAIGRRSVGNYRPIFDLSRGTSRIGRADPGGSNRPCAASPRRFSGPLFPLAFPARFFDTLLRYAPSTRFFRTLLRRASSRRLPAQRLGRRSRPAARPRTAPRPRPPPPSRLPGRTGLRSAATRGSVRRTKIRLALAPSCASATSKSSTRSCAPARCRKPRSCYAYRSPPSAKCSRTPSRTSASACSAARTAACCRHVKPSCCSARRRNSSRTSSAFARSHAIWRCSPKGSCASAACRVSA